MLHIEPLHKEYHSCIEDIIATVAAYLNRSHELMYAESWCFRFHKDSSTDSSLTLGTRIHEGEDKAWGLLETYHGIRLNLHKVEAVSDITDILRCELQEGRPVIIYLDDYWCPWSKKYQRLHEIHPCLAIGYDGKKQIVHCIDPYTTRDMQILTADHCGRMHLQCVVFHIRDVWDTQVNVGEMMHRAASLMLSGDSEGGRFEEMRCFADHIEQGLDLSMEIIEKTDTVESPLLDRIKYITRRRIQFITLIDYFMKCNSENDVHVHLLEHSRQIKHAAQLWEIISQLLLRMYYTNSWITGREKIAFKVREVADYEEAISKHMLETYC